MKIALIGDIGLFGCNSGLNPEGMRKFDAIVNILRNHDYVIGNLETPLTYCTKQKTGKSAHIKGVPDDVALLKHLGVTHVSLANNHMLDYGVCGLNDTVDALEAVGIRYFGISNQVCELKDDSANISLRGYCCYSTNGFGLGTNINILDPGAIELDISEDRGKGKMTILSCHWGIEHVNYPNFEHLLMSRALCRKYDGLIIHGHHPHVIQGMEQLNGGMVAYSLGNFCFDDVYTKRSQKPLVELSENNKQSLILSLTIIDNKIKEIERTFFKFDTYEYTVEDDYDTTFSEYCDFLNADKLEYINKRSTLINQRLQERRNERDICWYLNRINTNSALMMIYARKNRTEYKRLMHGFI